MATDEQQLKAIMQTETPNATEIDIDCLKQIATTQEELSKVKTSLNEIVDSMTANQSLVSRVADQWGELEPWQKVAGGVTITLAAVPAALVANASIIFTVCGVSLTAYVTGGYILEDHHLCSRQVTDNVKKGVLSLANILEVTIKALDKIRDKFNEEIDKFKVQNVLLADNVASLTEQIESLTSQLELFIATEKLLRSTKEELEKTNLSLQTSKDQQSQLLEANQKELVRITLAYDGSRAQLEKKIDEIATLKKSLGSEVEKVKNLASTLKGTVTALTGHVIADKKKREQLNERLDQFLNDKEKNFNQLVDSLSNTEQALSKGKDELSQTNQRFEELLNRGEAQLARLASITAQQTHIPNMGKLLAAQGFYGTNQNGGSVTGLNPATALCV